MPSRLITTAIILFWIVITSVLLYRELGPRFRAGEAPPFTIDLTAEVGANIVNWNVLQKGKQVGSGSTKVKRESDRTFNFTAEFQLDKFKAFGQELRLKVKSAYVVTEEGALKAGEAHVDLDWFLPIKIDFEGKVREREFHPRLAVHVNGESVKAYQPEPFAVSESGSILNPMHLVHKISGLRDGQSWPIPLMDPFRAVPENLRGVLPGRENLVSQVFATVTTEEIEFNGETVSCFKISYAKADDRPMAATWVRRRDAVVLQQWAGYEGIEYTLQRSRAQ